jgi:hypothetical protein
MHGDWDFLPNAPTKGNKEFLERGAPRRIAWQVLSELEIRAHLAMHQILAGFDLCPPKGSSLEPGRRFTTHHTVRVL